jgi:predicted adenylyl cyclase CyaB
MARNVEIKARIGDLAATRRLVEGVADGPPETLAQTDIFFGVGHGRLKLREQSGAGAELIYYERADRAGPKESRFERIAVPDAPALRSLLAPALGVCGQVTKRRLAYRVGRTRVHLDEVRGLGAFLELEVELAPDEPAEEGAEEAQRLMRRFGIGADALVPEAYVDLLTREAGSGGGGAGRARPAHSPPPPSRV